MRTILGAAHAEVIAVGTTPTPLDSTGASRPRDGRKSVLVGNGSAVVYLGGPDVTVASGYPLAAGSPISFDAARGALYAVAAGPATVSILEGY